VAPRYTPFDGRPQTISMGLRPLDLAHWLEPDAHRDGDLRAKAELLRTRHAEVVATTPAGDAGSQETLELVRADLERRRLSVSETAIVAGLHPIDAAGRLVQEDLCVMVREGARDVWVLAAASVCAPSRWRLADKVGADLRGIHAPVPDYERIAAPTDRFFDRITLDRPVWRTNWTLLDDPALFQPTAPADTGTATVDAGAVVLRVERQTLRLLPHSGAVLFTIRTYDDPLGALSDAATADLDATLAHVDPELIAYRGWQRLLPAVCDRLARPRSG
jgi:hypothetical protein